MSKNTNTDTQETTVVAKVRDTDQGVPVNVSDERRQGKVKWFVKGYGFITDLDTQQDYFVHFTSLQVGDGSASGSEDNETDSSGRRLYAKLFKGEYVEYSVGTDNQGQECACNVSGLRGGPLLCESSPNLRYYTPTSNNSRRTTSSRNTNGGGGRQQRHQKNFRQGPSFYPVQFAQGFNPNLYSGQVPMQGMIPMVHPQVFQAQQPQMVRRTVQRQNNNNEN